MKKLREMTFAPIKDCKEALAEAGDDLEKAQEVLKKKGIAKAGTRAERETKEGIVKVVENNGKIAGLKLLCETDFVAKNENFQGLFDSVLSQIAKSDKEVSSFEDLDPTIAKAIDDEVKEFMGKTGENMNISGVLVTTQKAFVYNHPGNRVSSLIFFEGGNDEIAKELALQVTAMNPTYVSFDQVDEKEIAKLKEEFSAELKAAGKPEAMIAQIVEGKIKKALADNVLLEQECIRDGSKKVKEILPADMKVTKFIRMAI
ncbi:TPA: translation elongation factor Ts [Patescibacteria group bacterium]|nr:translation elongation factor Ts [Candidatus Gracilibacteria bacterium]